jgi:hypothetical protein
MKCLVSNVSIASVTQHFHSRLKSTITKNIPSSSLHTVIKSKTNIFILRSRHIAVSRMEKVCRKETAHLSIGL